jgi:hypothetical protein
MAKSKEPPELPLPPDFFGGDGPNKGGDNVIPFGKRPPPLKIRLPGDPAPAGDRIKRYHLTDEELLELRSYLNSKPRLKQLAVPGDMTRDAVNAVGSGPPLDDSPLAMLKDLVHQIEAGHIHPQAAIVATVEFAPDGTEQYPFYVARLSRLQVMGLLHELLENLP